MAEQPKNVEPAAIFIRPKFAFALTDPLRARILKELDSGPISPSRFAETFGGDLSEVARGFRHLKNWGYAEVGEERGGRRHASAIEHVYERTQRAALETAAWGRKGRSRRGQATLAVLHPYLDQIARAIEGGYFDQEPDRHVSWDIAALDQVAWRELSAHLAELAASLPGRAVDPSHADEEAIPTVVHLSAFRSAIGSEKLRPLLRRRLPRVATEERRGPVILCPETAKALANPLRSRIMWELTMRPMSPSQFVEEIGGDASYTARSFRELTAWGFIEAVEERHRGHRGGGVERIYSNLKLGHITAGPWTRLPRFLRHELSHGHLNSYLQQITQALDAGTFDADADRHLSSNLVLLDRSGWELLGNELDDLLYSIPDLERESINRARGNSKNMIPATVGLARFRAAEPRRSG